MGRSRHQDSVTAINIGLVANIVLAAVKTAIGILGHSPALLADGINSTSDVAYLVVVRIFVGLARKPADPEHPFGHTQLESIAALVVGAFVITTAVTIFWDSINNVYDVLTGVASFGGAAALALWVALATIALKVGLTAYTFRVGRRTESAAVLALAYDHRNDIFSAGAAAIGITFGRMGYTWVDPLVGALVALVVLRTGIEILRESSSDLMDTVPGRTLSRQIREVLAGIPEVHEVQEIRAHRFGPYLTLALTIGVDGDLSVAEGDRVASEVEERLYERIDVLRAVNVHYHPAEEYARHPPLDMVRNSG
ncbi:MAG: cation diffusion facilitator family transporter [Anaerolineae bacterium]